MLQLETKPAALPDGWHAPGEDLLAGSVGFTGDVNGIVHVQVTVGSARTLAGRLLGLAEADLEGDEIVNDAICELTNMIVGCAKSRLCDNGARCALTIPSIVRGQIFEFEPVLSHKHHRLGFQCGADHILIQLVMDPSMQPHFSKSA
jgi:CheY-specific phosphatase CheX